MIQNGRPRAFVPASLRFPTPCIPKSFKVRPTATWLAIYYYRLSLADLRPGGQLAKACLPAGEIFEAMTAKTP